MDKWLIGLKPVYEGLWWCLQQVDGASRTTVRAPWSPVEDGNQLHSHTYTHIHIFVSKFVCNLPIGSDCDLCVRMGLEYLVA